MSLPRAFRASFRFWPGICALCRGPSDQALDLCCACAAELPWREKAQHCRQCGLHSPNIGLQLCGQCQRKPPSFDALYAAWRYAFPLSKLISSTKHQRRRDYGMSLSALWQQRCEAPMPDCFVPVPLHWRRLWWRGFNQAALIADCHSDYYQRPVLNAVRRIAATSAQQGLDRKARLQNLRQAFRVSSEVQGLHIALVDDVVTTGATCEQIAKQLKQAGAARVDVWTLARTEL